MTLRSIDDTPADLGVTLTRRGVLLVLAAQLLPAGCHGETPRWRLLLSDPALCGGCSRCAITCAAFRDDGRGPPHALVSPDRSYQLAQFDGAGYFADTCRMCPEVTRDGKRVSPACVVTCPRGAARIAAPDDPLFQDFALRHIDDAVCVGCGRCVKACPYAHPVLYGGRASKCDLCIGRAEAPPCVDACPSSALLALEHWSLSPTRPFSWEPGS